MQLVALACNVNMTETALEIGSPVDPGECCQEGESQNDNLTTEPNGSNTEPNGSNTIPNGSNTGPNGTNTESNGANTETNDSNTDTKDSESNGLKTEVDGLNTETKDLNTEPSDLNAETNGVNTEPNSSNVESGRLNTGTDVVSTEPNGSNIESDGLNTESNHVNTEPDGSNIDSDGLNAEPNGSNIESDVLNTETNHVNTEPDGSNIDSDGLNPETNGVNTEQNDPNIDSDGINHEPGGSNVESDGCIKEPNGVSIEPSDSNTEPVVSSEEPHGLNTEANGSTSHSNDLTTEPNYVSTESHTEINNTKLEPSKLTAENEMLRRELSTLKEKVNKSNSTIHSLQAQLVSQQSRSNSVVTSLSLQLHKTEEALRRHRLHSDNQLEEVIAHLIFLEGKLKREQTQVKSVIKTKEETIRKQKYEIEDLTLRNERLVQAMKENYARTSQNGITVGHSDQKTTENVVPPSPSPSVKVKSNKSAFSSVKEKLWKHHRSSLDLTEGQVNAHGNLKEGRQYSSQENLSSLGVKKRELRASRDKKCKSIAGYPDHSLEGLIPEEAEVGFDPSQNRLKQQNDSRNSLNGTYSNGYHDSDLDHLSISSRNLMSAASLPVLSKPSDSPLKERPHSISSIESLSERSAITSPPPKSATPTPTAPPVQQTHESNPFKNLKTILKRKGSKSKKQKRNVSVSENTNQESVIKHFEKYEMA